jgi:hypothetical protein
MADLTLSRILQSLFARCKTWRLRGSTIGVALILSFDPVLVVVLNDHWGDEK